MPDSADVPDFAAGLHGVPVELIDALCEPLVDHHVHGCFTGPISRAGFEAAISEGTADPAPTGTTRFDSQIGVALLRWCAPVLGLPPHAAADDYWATRAQAGPEAVSRAMLRTSGVRRWLVDTGFAPELLTAPATLARWSAGTASEVLRLESLGEALVTQVPPAGYADAVRDRLSARGPTVVAAKSIIAYRCGFDIDWSDPSESAVAEAVTEWVRQLEHSGQPPRMTSPVLSRFGIHAAARAGLPIQLHVGFGDRDLDLRRADPLLLLPLLREPSVRRVAVVLLHCYPFHRSAGYLAQAFDNVYFDVGLAVNYLGVRAPAVLAESLELTPFGKQLYSSDAFGVPELHLLGSVLWRRAMARVLARWVAEGDWSLADAVRLVRLVGVRNAGRVYGL